MLRISWFYEHSPIPHVFVIHRAQCICELPFSDGGEKQEHPCASISAHVKDNQVVKVNPVVSTAARPRVYILGAW